MEIIVAIDPGRSKCGLAVVSGPDPVRVLRLAVVDTQRVTLEVAAARRSFPEICRLILGNGTGSAGLRKALRESLPEVPAELVQEHGTSAQARARFLRERPAPGWRRILPPGLRAPERPYDDFVALILAERYFSKTS